MGAAAKAKRLVYLVHRWTGVFACVLIALWVVSGVVMLFIGYPKLLPQERLEPLQQLSLTPCCLSVATALRHSASPDEVLQIVLTSIDGKPVYRIKERDGSFKVVDALQGNVAGAISTAFALRSAQAFLPASSGSLLGKTQDDRWTHSGALDPHRPLIKVQMDDAQAQLLYISSTTGEVVMAAPKSQRYWNYVGAWLHWVYMFRDGSKDAVWSWIVIVLSAIGTVSALAGALVGIWRWRFRGRYKSGAKTPYREFQMRWHHITGLLFGLVMVLWIFSGLMSMNPLGIFSARAQLDKAGYQKSAIGQVAQSIDTRQALAALQAADFETVEVEWLVLVGRPYLLAQARSGDTRVVQVVNGTYEVREGFSLKELEEAARALSPYAIQHTQLLHQFDAYYYRRGESSMYAGASRSLPVLKIQFSDPGQTIAYLDIRTGKLLLSLDRAQRTGRWLFNLFHSWDLHWMLRYAGLRDLALVLLSIGALALSLTGVVIGFRRLALSTK